MKIVLETSDKVCVTAPTDSHGLEFERKNAHTDYSARMDGANSWGNLNHFLFDIVIIVDIISHLPCSIGRFRHSPNVDKSPWRRQPCRGLLTLLWNPHDAPWSLQHARSSLYETRQRGSIVTARGQVQHESNSGREATIRGHAPNPVP